MLNFNSFSCPTHKKATTCVYIFMIKNKIQFYIRWKVNPLLNSRESNDILWKEEKNLFFSVRVGERKINLCCIVTNFFFCCKFKRNLWNDYTEGRLSMWFFLSRVRSDFSSAIMFRLVPFLPLSLGRFLGGFLRFTSC